MSDNIMDMVKGVMSDQIMGKLGGLLGTGDKTSSHFESAAGSILGGLLKKTSTAQGQQQVFEAVQKQDNSILDKLGDLLGGGDATEGFQKQGGGILDMVLGGGQQNTSMITSIAKALGLGESVVGKMLMMAAPIVMGVIGRHVKAKALDAVGLGNFLGSQKSNISGVLPAGLAGNLGFGNLLGSASDAVSGAASSVGNAVGGAANTVGNAAGAVGNTVGNAAGAVGGAAGNAAGAVGGAAGDVAKSGGGLLKLLLPLILLGALGYFAVTYFANGNNPAGGGGEGGVVEGEGGGEGSGMKMPEMPSFGSIPGLDALGETGTKLTDGFSSITTGLKDVTDEEGAQGLATTITDFTGGIGDLGLGNLEGTAKTASSSMIGMFIDSVKGMLAGKSEGIQGILQPAIDKLIEVISPFK